MNIYLIRHFKTAGNLEKRYVGRTNEDIVEYTSNKKYPKADLVFTSSMKRCIQTAELIYPQTEIRRIPLLREMDFGVFEYKNYKELKHDKRYQLWIDGVSDCPEGEKKEQFIARVGNGFMECIETAENEGCQEIAFVIHGGSVMAILSEFTGGNFYDYQVPSGGGYHLSFKDGKLKILGEL